jgi:hypothetical protein
MRKDVPITAKKEEIKIPKMSGSATIISSS